MDLHKNKGQVTVVIDLSFSASLDEVKEFILNEQSPFILSQSDENLLKFEWFIDEDTKTATLLEVFANAEGFEVLAGKVMGTPVNLKFRDLFTVEKMTILGEPTESLKETISVMNPTIKKDTGGINQEDTLYPHPSSSYLNCWVVSLLFLFFRIYINCQRI